jgi:glycosyltransferase involved in cell wall biosynthesis
MDGVDWYWLPSIFRAFAFLWRQRPQILVLQWWTGTVLHTYLALVLVARLFGARIVIEFHETLDTGEDRIPFVPAYVRTLGSAVLRLADGYAFHARSEVAAVTQRYGLVRRPSVILPHGPHDHYQRSGADRPPRREAPADAWNILFFGIIRPYKGLEDLVQAFERLCDRDPEAYWLTVVGETWEGWGLPIELLERSRWRHRVTLINEYVHDDEVAPLFAGADTVAFPYRRSAISGPVHIAMGFGLPLVVTDVGGLAESVSGYGGAVVIPPENLDALVDGIERARQLGGTRWEHPQSWDRTLEAYDRLFAKLLDRTGSDA